MFKSFIKSVSRFAKAVAEAFYPMKCICCGEIIDSCEYLCDVCRRELKIIRPDKRCMYCGLEMGHCMCKYHVYHFENIISVYVYEGAARKAMHRFKLYRRMHYAEFFAQQMSLAVRNEYRNINFDFICSVPSSVRSRLKRGFQPSGMMARRMSEILGIPIFDGVISCKPFRRAQHFSGYEQRLKNVKDKYKFVRRIDGAVVLLVDDIKTTGATLDECARELLLAGADRVYAVTAMATGLNNDAKSDKK